MSGISPFSKSKQSPLILVADDDKTIRVWLRRSLELEGYQVVEATNGQECLDAYETMEPDIILLDAVMPIMDGFTCCKRLLQIARNKLMSVVANFDTDSVDGNTIILKLWKYTPILMITSLNDDDSVERAFQAGATDYITKPIHWAMLRHRVQGLLKQAQVYKQLEAANESLQQLAHVDSLTGLANRRCFDQYLSSQWLTLAQERSPLSLILCDLDFFKLYNDKYGHPTGDICLQKVGTVLSRTARKNQDLVARYGGEEFAVIMPNTDERSALHLAATMVAEVRKLEIAHDGSIVSQFVTLTLGVATIIPSFESSPSDLIVAADKALYQAKAEGRNCIRPIAYSSPI